MTSSPTGRRVGAAWLGLAVVLALAAAPGCEMGPAQGPGHRRQSLALSPEQELSLGKQAYEKVCGEYPEVKSGRAVERVRSVGQRIVRASEIKPLQREINLRVEGYPFEWEFKVLESGQVNAFCLPGGKVAVFTGLLDVAETDDELATVLGHEISHALAHHASERIAREQMLEKAERAAAGSLPGLSPEDQKKLIGLLGAGAELGSLAYDRRQESEADHIGVFLMTFADYDPDQAVRFWEKMEELGRKRGRPPVILSDHPSDAQRIAQIRKWAVRARDAKLAWKQGRVVQD